MTFEIDPDIRLFTRLAVGRGWRWRVLVAASTVGLASMWMAITVASRQYPEFRRSLENSEPFFLRPQGIFLFLALVLLMVAPMRAIMRLVVVERSGLLDQTRLCGRPAHRLLIAALAGSTWTMVLGSLMSLVVHLGSQGGDPRSLLFAALLFAAATTASLLVYGVMPEAIIARPEYVAGWLMTCFGIGIVGIVVFLPGAWAERPTFDGGVFRFALASVAGGLPLAFWVARRRLVRPGAAESHTIDARGIVRRVPQVGSPEFNRYFRMALAGGRPLAIMLAAVLAVVLKAASGAQVSGTDPGFGTFTLVAMPIIIPYVAVLIGGAVVSTAVLREVETGTIDLVKLTAQRAESVVLGWYGGGALPCWGVALVASLAIGLVLPTDLPLLGWLPGVALVFPAVVIASAVFREQTTLWGGLTVLTLVGTQVAMRTGLSTRPMRFAWFSRLSIGVEHVDPGALVPALGTALLIAAVAGQLRRPAGPCLAGAVAAAAIVAIAASTRVLPAVLFPRVFPGLLAVLASFAAEERDRPTPPWERLATTGIAALLAGAVLTRTADFGWSAALATGVGAALSMGIGLLAHEIAWRVPAWSLVLRLAVLAGVAGFIRGVSIARLPATLQSIDLVVLAIAFTGVVVVHRRRTAPAGAYAPA